MVKPQAYKFSSILSHSIRLSVFGLLTLLSIVFTFLPDQKVPQLESTAWVTTGEETIEAAQLKTSFYAWQKSVNLCLASFEIFYPFVFEVTGKLHATRVAHFQRQVHFLRPNLFSPRLIYPSPSDEIPNFLYC